MGQEVDVLAPKRDVGHSVGGIAGLGPRRLARHGGGQRRHIHLDLVLDAPLHQPEGHVAPGLGRHDREVDVLHRNGGIRSLGQHLQVAARIASEPVHPGDAVQIVVRVAVLGPLLQPVEEQARAVGQPRRRAGLGAVEALRQDRAGRRQHDLQRGVFRPCGRNPVGDIASVGRGLPIVQGIVGCTRGQGVRVDQQPVGARQTLADVELIGVGARRPHLGEDVGSGGLDGGDDDQRPGHRADLGGEVIAAGDRRQELPGVGVLAHQIGHPLWILGVFHPAVAVGDRGPEQLLCHRPNRGDRRLGRIGSRA